MARSRLSSHDLHVEKGRHNRVAYADRVCLRCNADGAGGVVDDEFHLLFQCCSSLPTRSDAQFKCVFDALPSQDVRCMMNFADVITVSHYVHRCMVAVAMSSDSGTSNAEQPQAEGQPPM